MRLCIAPGQRYGRLRTHGQLWCVFVSSKYRQLYPLSKKGEIDILEGVNNQAYNQATLHTSAGVFISSLYF